MADAAHDWTEDEIKKLEARIVKAYSDAYAEAVNLNQNFLKDFDKKLKEWRETVKKDPGKQKAFKSWLNEQLFKREFRHDLVEQLARDLVETERGAAAIINDELPIIFAQNANYAMYTIENQAKMAINFQLVDQDTVRRLLRDQPDVLPLVSPDGKKAMKWNTEKVRNAVTQSILLGESIPNMAKRLQGVYKMGERMATMAARTAATGAENGGRVESYKRAEKMGIELEQEWVATLDDRTRDSHRMLDGEKVKVGEKFSNGLRFPGDPHGKPEEQYNCRCSLVAALKGIDLSDAKRHADFKEGQTYEEWKKGKSTNIRSDVSESIIAENEIDSTSIEYLKRPVRPKQSDYGGYNDEYLQAREDYHKQMEQYEEQLNKAIESSMNIVGFKNYNELELWAKDNNVSLSKDLCNSIDIKSFNEVKPTLEELFRRFPEVKEYSIEGHAGEKISFGFNIGITDDGLLSANGGFNLNPRYFSSYEVGLREALEGISEGMLVRGDGSFSTLVRHEYGHNVQSYLEFRIADKYHMNVDDWRLNYATLEDYKIAQSQYIEESHKFDRELRSLANLEGSSQYSNTNELELFAEGFAEWSSGGKTEFGKAFGEFISRWY